MRLEPGAKLFAVAAHDYNQRKDINKPPTETESGRKGAAICPSLSFSLVRRCLKFTDMDNGVPYSLLASLPVDGGRKKL